MSAEKRLTKSDSAYLVAFASWSQRRGDAPLSLYLRRHWRKRQSTGRRQTAGVSTRVANRDRAHVGEKTASSSLAAAATTSPERKKHNVQSTSRSTLTMLVSTSATKVSTKRTSRKGARTTRPSAAQSWRRRFQGKTRRHAPKIAAANGTPAASRGAERRPGTPYA